MVVDYTHEARMAEFQVETEHEQTEREIAATEATESTPVWVYALYVVVAAVLIYAIVTNI